MPARRAGELGAPVGEPPVVRAQAGEAQLEVVGATARSRRASPPWGRTAGSCSGNDLGDDAVGLEVAHAPGAVPVAVGVGLHEVAVGAHEASPPSRRTRRGTRASRNGR